MTAAELFESAVRAAAGWVGYNRREGGTVERSPGGNVVDVRLDSGALLSGVDVRSIAPGSDVLPAVGVRCLVGYADGRRPYVAAFEADDAVSVTTLLPPGSSVARLGDSCDLAISLSDSLVGVVITPDAAVAAAISGGAATLAPGTPVTVVGLTTSGVPIVGAVTSFEEILRA